MEEDWGQSLVDNLNYNVLNESLAKGDNFKASEVLNLCRLAKKRNSDIEKDVKKYKAPL